MQRKLTHNLLNILYEPALVFDSILEKVDYTSPIILLILIDILMFLGGDKLSLVVIIDLAISFNIVTVSLLVYLWGRTKHINIGIHHYISGVSCTCSPLIIYYLGNVVFPNVAKYLDLGHLLIGLNIIAKDSRVANALIDLSIFHIYALVLLAVLIHSWIKVSMTKAIAVIFAVHVVLLMLLY